MTEHVDTLIVGAGPTGMGALWALDQPLNRDTHLLVEANSNAGGAASSERTASKRGDFTWDIGGHVIHSHFPDFDEAIDRCGAEMVEVPRNGAIWMGGRGMCGQWINAPIQQQVEVMPTDLKPGADAVDLWEYFRNEMGAELTASFFEPFNMKMWGLPLNLLDHTWTSLRSGSGAANVPKVMLKRERDVETFPYPLRGTGDLWAMLSKRFDPAYQQYGTRLTGIDMSEHVAHFDAMNDVHYERMISTVPLTSLCELTGDADLEALATGLASTRVNVVGFGFEGELPECLRDRTYIYSPNPADAWHRATILSNYSAHNAPEGCWSVLFEVSNGAQFYRESLELTLVQWGADMGAEISRWTKQMDHGYPIPMLGRDDLLRPMHQMLESADIQSRGRFGGWRYESCNQDYSFAQGVEAVEHGTADVLWHPEKF